MGALTNIFLTCIWKYPTRRLVKEATAQNQALIFKDVIKWCETFGINKTGEEALLWLLIDKKEFRNLFYYRINPKCLGQKIHWWCLPALESLSIYVDELGENVVFHHPFSTILNAKKIGHDCVIRNNTTIGNKNEDQRYRPTLGNHVIIGPNSVIIGDVIIEDNVIIGAGSVVVKNISSNSVVAGNPARPIIQ